MSLDPLLPIAPARVKALVLPIGRIKRDRFAAFVDRLNAEHVVHLRDISPDGRPHRNMFSPLAFPDGAMFYELITHNPPPSHLAMSPFDLYREPLALIAVADGAEISKAVLSKRMSSGRTVEENNIRSLDQELEELRDRYPKILAHQVLLFDYVPSREKPVPIPEGSIITIPPLDQQKRTTMKTVMCDISAMVLAEMTTLAKSFEGMGFIDSPGNSSNGRHPSGEEPSGPARRNSQYAMPTGARSSSTGGLADRSHVRMSMPPAPSKSGVFGSAGSTPNRPSTPVNNRSALANPPTNSDDIRPGINGSDPASPEQSNSRPGTSDGFRTQSQDRISVQGFGPGGLNDRWRAKGKCRVQIVVGSLYLQAGLWGTAVKELSEAAAVAKSMNDHIWHGKALELITISLLLLGWAELEFQVPNVLLPPPEKGNGLATALQEAETRCPKQPRWLRHLQVYMPDLLERIIVLYSKVSTEHLPPLPLSEAVIRFGKILAALHVADGELGQVSLQMMVFNKLPEKRLTTSPRFNIIPPEPNGIASVLGALGLQRKKAIVVRELVSVLIAGLVEARTRGAADVGIHPAAGLVALNSLGGHSNGTTGAAALELGEGDIEHGIDSFLSLLLKTYGIVGEPLASATLDHSDTGVLERIQRQSAARAFGMQNAKLNILRSCINFSEALPDFAGVLKYSSDLMRTAGSGIAPGPRRENAYPVIAREEQTKLVTNITKTSNLAKKLGMDTVAAEYWDEFLLRGVKLEPLPLTRTPVAHAKSVLPDATTARASQDVNPFIYNPFLKQPDTAAVEKVLIAGETAGFRLTLQNPYEVDLVVESVRLEAEGADFESGVEGSVIGAYRTQVLRVAGTPTSAGSLKITGALIRVRGCRERRFPIFPEPWSADGEVKIKSIGLGALDLHSAALSPSAQKLKPESLELTVIAPQPVVVVKSSTLPQSSVMILEGERQTFSLTLQNLSSTTPVDFLLFSFQDSTQEPLQTALSSRDATPAELYEYELILAKKQALKLRKRGDRKRFIPAGGTGTFEFEILGKPGLTTGTIQVDYAHLGVPHDDVDEKFFTRRVSQELTVTVNASVEVARIDVLPLHGSIPEPLWRRTGYKDRSPDLTPDSHCLLVLDLRNAWPSNMVVELESDDGATIEEHILPGHTSRVILPIKRIYLDDPHAFIPALNPSRQRQFVVSTKISPDVERANREAFWYRETVLNTLRATWRALGASRTGAVELRTMRLTSRMIEAVKVDEVGIEISVVTPDDDDDSSDDDDDESETAPANGDGIVTVDEPFELRVRITNRTDAPIYPTLRLMPALCHRPLNVALDFTRKLAWNGTLQQALPALPGKGMVEVTTGVTALCRGEFEVTASIEETKLTTGGEEEARRRRRTATGGRPRSETETLMMDAVLGKRERRIWHSRRACRLFVRDKEEEEGEEEEE
ncbi:TRAPP II complex [Schizothecium vesticola]|uniref:TRAPP II complex n=1 Tax=Schizothecium vesticola TaxID=314040 RepID=A0AA40KD60_9PEZI|nr:TRAPP II complex [Schizothecium vesticola]